MFLEKKSSIEKITIVIKLIYAIRTKIIRGFFKQTWQIDSKIIIARGHS